MEGAELTVLHTFDWRVPVKVFCIEIDREKEYGGPIRALMEENGYVETNAFQLGRSNVVFVHRSLNATLDARIRHCAVPAATRGCNREL